jgi:hypothetical protein
MPPLLASPCARCESPRSLPARTSRRRCRSLSARADPSSSTDARSKRSFPRASPSGSACDDRRATQAPARTTYKVPPTGRVLRPPQEPAKVIRTPGGTAKSTTGILAGLVQPPHCVRLSKVSGSLCGMPPRVPLEHVQTACVSSLWWMSVRSNAAVTCGSNWVPAHRRSSAIASAVERIRVYGRDVVIAS